MIVAGGGGGYGSPLPPRVYTEQQAVAAWWGTLLPATTSQGASQPVMESSRFESGPQPTFPLGSIYPQIGESGRNSNLLTADAQNLQTAAAAALDARDHPGTSEAIVTASATARVRALGGSLTEAEVRAVLVVAGSPAEWIDDLVAISWCESKHSPNAIGDGGNSLGEWQMWAPWFAAAGEDPSQWADPVVNARVAIHVRQVRGRLGGGGGWSCADLWGIP